MTLAPSDDVVFLQWALPRLGLRWRGFRRVRKQVLKRIARRRRELGLADLASYRAHLELHEGEWRHLEPLCRVTISRFHRDRATFESLRGDVLPALAARARIRGAPELRALSVGCASGEEPYTLALIDRFEPCDLPLAVVAIDADAHLLGRAQRGRYRRGTLRELPPGWIRDAFHDAPDGELELDEDLRSAVRFRHLDLRRDALPIGPFDLVLCRNLAFTYFDEAGQRRALAAFAERLVEGGALVLGGHEVLPTDPRFAPWVRCIWRQVSRPQALERHD